MPTKIFGVKRSKSGLILCEHNIIKYSCKVCNSKIFCKHGVIKRQCVPCKGAAICEHGRLKYQCRGCHGGSICLHDKLRSKCADCYPMGIYKDYKNGAKKRNHIFELTFEDYEKLSKSSCVYCGENSLRNGIDRKDNSVGYTSENSVPCCIKCNSMKSNYLLEEFLAHAKRIASFQLKGETK